MTTRSNTYYIHLFILCLAAAACSLIAACHSRKSTHGVVIASAACYPNAVLHNGKYYFICQIDDARKNIVLHCAENLADIMNGDRRVIWEPDDSASCCNLWAPELHRINNKWYVYFEADDGNTDNHQMYVLENTSDDPIKGTFRLKGKLKTNDEWNWGIHPSTFTLNNRQYLVWSGWPKRRSETETQCLYIAAMSNPWTVCTERVMISRPVYEWERQWINPDGTRSTYPIYVNENPQPVISRDGKKVAIYYSASGCWTAYTCLGAVYADASADLLDSRSWHKAAEPVMTTTGNDSIKAPTDICLVPDSKSDKTWLLYETKYYNPTVHAYVKQIRMKHIAWGDDGLPIFGKP